MTVNVMIGNKVYSDAVSNIHTSPEVCLTCTELPIGQVTFDVKTTDTIQLGSRAIVYETYPSEPYVAYWVTSAVRNGETVSVVAKSVLYMLDSIELEAEMFDDISVHSAIIEVFMDVINTFPQTYSYYVDSSYSETTITGYCPKQSARERLLWICMAIGAYVDTSFTTLLCRILPISAIMNDIVTVPMTDVFYRPQISEDDYVTAIKITAYSYREGTPSTTDKWVEADGDYYIETQTEYTLTNPNIPVTVTDNPVVIDSVKLMNTGNVNEILTLLSLQYFKNTVVDAEIIHKPTYGFGQTYLVPINERTYVHGYISSMDFVFGSMSNKVRVDIRQIGTESIAKITIERKWGKVLLKREKYYFPAGVLYSIQNPYIDKRVNDHRYVFIPDDEYATGTVSDGLIDTELYDVAVDYYQNHLYIISVDELSFDGEVLTIG